MSSLIEEFRQNYTLGSNQERFQTYTQAELRRLGLLVDALGLRAVVECAAPPAAQRPMSIGEIASRHIETGILTADRFVVTPLIGDYSRTTLTQREGAAVYAIPGPEDIVTAENFIRRYLRKINFSGLIPRLWPEELEEFPRMVSKFGFELAGKGIEAHRYHGPESVASMVRYVDGSITPMNDQGMFAGPRLRTNGHGQLAQYTGLSLYKRILQKNGSKTTS